MPRERSQPYYNARNPIMIGKTWLIGDPDSYREYQKNLYEKKLARRKKQKGRRRKKRKRSEIILIKKA